MLLKERVKILKKEVIELNEQIPMLHNSVDLAHEKIRFLEDKVKPDILQDFKKRLYQLEELMSSVNSHFKDEREKRFTLEEKYRILIAFLKQNLHSATVENILMEIGEL
jgi:chromosome segregation ATPase